MQYPVASNIIYSWNVSLHSGQWAQKCSMTKVLSQSEIYFTIETRPKASGSSSRFQGGGVTGKGQDRDKIKTRQGRDKTRQGQDRDRQGKDRDKLGVGGAGGLR